MKAYLTTVDDTIYVEAWTPNAAMGGIVLSGLCARYADSDVRLLAREKKVYNRSLRYVGPASSPEAAEFCRRVGEGDLDLDMDQNKP